MKMSRKTDMINRDELCRMLHTYWHPTPRSMRILEKRIWQPPYPPDFDLKMYHDDRIWHKLELNESNDAAYKMYVKYIEHYVGHDSGLINYDVWKSGTFHGARLFKYLRHHMPQSRIERLTTSRNTETSFLVVSKNPIDIFLCSSGQSFSSCMGLGSTYSGAYYMSLPGYIVDPARFMVFRTPGRIARSQFKDVELAHFRYLQRAFAFWTTEKELYPIRSYPEEYTSFYKLFEHTDTPISNEDMWKTNRHPLPSLKSKCGYYMTPYQDVSTRYNEHLTSVRYGYVNSSGPSGPRSLEYTGSFENMPDKFMVYGFIGKTCRICNKYKRDGYRIELNKRIKLVCPDCINKYLFQCQNCTTYYHKSHNNYTTIPRFSSRGEEVQPLTYCSYCMEAHHITERLNIVTCGHCNVTTNIQSAPFLSYEHVCYKCVPQARRARCYFCEDMHLKKDMDQLSGGGHICSSCWDKAYWCTSCIRPFVEGHALKRSKRAICRNCVQPLYTDSYAGKDPQYDAWNNIKEIV